ncbi:hypothetical protein DXG03_004785 [Asterophora parasitica]|uniref:BTB domain-containing protein n=1 Tax=Asterophora parasitica TaxID=117018 RepID=A0A9P7G0S8_9AGAR|nr:hypothetical protein DXG03_004785 [Asterophora parasitica]
MDPDFGSPVVSQSTLDPWPLPEERRTKTRDLEYFMTSAIFEVEDKTYRVPTHYFQASTDFFNSHFDSTTASRDECPLRLEDVTKADFRALLNLMYPMTLTLTRTLSDDEWVSVLKLSTKWKMLDVRRMAIEHLAKASIPPADKVVLGRTYGIVEWLRSGYVALADVTDDISAQAAEQIGLESALKLHRSRDNVLRALSTWRDDRPIDPAVDAAFTRELHGLQRSPIEKVLLARMCNVAEWLRAAYVELVERKASLSVEEAATIGYETTIRLCGVRERRLSQDSNGVGGSCSLVNEAMKVELGEVLSHKPVDRMILARAYGVPEWVRSALVELVHQGDISPEDGARMKLDTAISVYRVREALYDPVTSSQLELEIGNAVDCEFGEELRRVRAMGDVLRIPGKVAMGDVAEVRAARSETVATPAKADVADLAPSPKQAAVAGKKKKKAKK